MVGLAPQIFPDAGDWIGKSIPSAGDLTQAIENFKTSSGAIGSSGDLVSNLGAFLETIVNGFVVVGNLFKSAIFCLPELLSALNLPPLAVGIVGVLQSVLYIMLGIALIQLITGRYFINVE